VDIRIGVVNTVKELEVEMAADTDRDALHTKIDDVLADDDKVLWLEDRHGAQHAIPSAKVAYIQVGRPDGERRIGFGA
jgi:hypothetical protein